MKRMLISLGICLGQTIPTAFAAEAKAIDSDAAAPAVGYRSAFEGYRPFREQPIANWRALNAEVGAVGGHVGIVGGAGGNAAKVADKPAAAPIVTTEGGQAPASGGHRGH